MRNYSLARNEILFCVFGPGVQKVAHPWSNENDTNFNSKPGEDEDEIQGIIVALVTIGIDEIVEVAAYECPCIAESDLVIPYTAAFPRR